MCFRFIKQQDFKKKTITSFECITLRLSGMRLTCEYEIKCTDSIVEINYYQFCYATGKETRQLIKSVVCDTETVLLKLNECELMRWDGFHGKHPKGVCDGTMFTLNAIVNEDKKIYADGSQNFPKHFRELEHWLNELIR